MLLPQAGGGPAPTPVLNPLKTIALQTVSGLKVRTLCACMHTKGMQWSTGAVGTYSLPYQQSHS